jgi:hypothetical protein
MVAALQNAGVRSRLLHPHQKSIPAGDSFLGSMPLCAQTALPRRATVHRTPVGRKTSADFQRTSKVLMFLTSAAGTRGGRPSAPFPRRRCRPRACADYRNADYAERRSAARAPICNDLATDSDNASSFATSGRSPDFGSQWYKPSTLSLDQRARVACSRRRSERSPGIPSVKRARSRNVGLGTPHSALQARTRPQTRLT